jgi:hypothetical protein
MKHVLIIIVCWIPALCGLAADTDFFDDSRTVLSNKWISGPTLVYDCQDGHWVCAMTDLARECDDKRLRELRVGKHFLTCFSAQTFPTPGECEAEQRRLTSSGGYPRPCLHPQVRGRFIGFQ